jgi:enoyl-CoA hydratase
VFETVTYEVPADRVARISLNRPAARNAQDTKLLYELNDAFDMAARDDAISVIERPALLIWPRSA